MNQNILYVGLDVDDTQYHGSAFNKATGEVIDFKCRPTLKGLLTQLDKLQRHFQGLSIRLCYEASYVGFLCSVICAPTACTAMWSRPAASPARAAKRSRPTASMRVTWRSSTPMTC